MQDKARALYALALARYPEGLLSESFLPVTLAGQEFELRCFTERGDASIGFGFFRKDRRYARKTLVVHQDGRIELDETGTIPQFDVDPLDAALTPSLQEVFEAADQAMRSHA